MGVSTNAVLFYGYCWEEEVQLVGDEDSWSRAVVRSRGHKNPWDALPKKLEDRADPEYVHDYQKRTAAVDAWRAEHRDAIDAWYGLLKSVEDEFGVELSYHCSDECAMPYLYVKDKDVVARRGYPVEIDPGEDFAVGPDWDAKLDRWLAEMGVEKPHPAPRWWLVSYWG